MTEESSRLLLLSSDLRRRYAEDIPTALALPEGSTIQFRYESRYVVPSLQRAAERKSDEGGIVGATVTLAFVSDPEGTDPFLMPVRAATVAEVNCAGDIFVFKLKIGDYYNLDEYPSKTDEITRVSREHIGRIISANGGYYPAVDRFGSLNLRKSRAPDSDWHKTAKRLLQHKTFAKSYFLRIDSPRTTKGVALPFDERGRLEVVDQESVHLPVTFFSDVYEPDAAPKLACTTDGTFLRVSSSDSYDVASRYDAVEFWLHPTSLNYNTLSRVTISLKGKQEDGTNVSIVPASAEFPVVVRRSTSRTIFRTSISAAGALLIALPAILGPSSMIELRISSALLGAALLAISTVVLGAAK